MLQELNETMRGKDCLSQVSPSRDCLHFLLLGERIINKTKKLIHIVLKMKGVDFTGKIAGNLGH